MAKMVLMAEVSGGRARERPRLGRMDGVKVVVVVVVVYSSSSRSSSSSRRTDRWVHSQQNAGLRLFVHT